MKKQTHKAVPAGPAVEMGFTLIEMLVSVVIFVIVLVAVYGFFDKGQWLYLQSDKKTNIQANARLTIEAIERDLRMIGYGVPKGGKSGASAVRWTPSIFTANSGEIGFRADIDNGSSYLRTNATGTTFNVDPDDVDKYPDGTNLILVSKGSVWYDSISTAVDAVSGSVDIADTLPTTFSAKSSKAYTMEEVSWRFTSNSSWPFGVVERQENQLRLPDGTAAGTWETVATNILSLTFEYYSGTTALTSLPLSSSDRSSVTRIVVTIVGKDRSDKPQEYQTVTLKSEIRIRNSGLIGG